MRAPLDHATSLPDRAAAGTSVLVVDDREEYRAIFAVVLGNEGYEVAEAADGAAALGLCEHRTFSLITLDVDMPGINGWETLRRLRARGCDTPVIMVTGLSSPEYRVRGLDAGADDFICKPCDTAELLARVRAVLRRRPAGPNVLRFGNVFVNLTARTAEAAGEPLSLTRTEYALLELFSQYQGRLLSRELILESVWGYADGVNTRTVETHIWRLRKKLGDRGDEPRWILTVPGGYRLDAPPVAAAA